MQVLSKEQKTYIEVHADEILKEKGISKAQFASALGVKPQNFGKLVSTRNIVTLMQIGKYLNIPLQVLVSGEEDKGLDIHGCIYVGGKPTLINGKDDIKTLLEKLEKTEV